ncbi:SpoIIIAH-like family protein [Candidatus Allofournierella excrementigallinarum]|uniref:SpoIIIAH-like family protein n=1 Tax=Candidatus Allofournierella excrementigallinarum TaxID=2838592 RepID=UPI00374F2F7C
MRSKKLNQKMTLLTLVVALGVAVYLNWEYAKSTDLALDAAEANAPVTTTGVVTDALAVDGDVDTGDKNYGEAQLVSVGEPTGKEFFEQARLDRTKTRDEALDTLQKSLKSAKLSDEEKDALTAQLTAAIDSITAESDIETLVKAKGFVDCVAFINGDAVDVTVMTTSDGLTKEEVAQIRDIVLSKCQVTAQNITIVEVK